MSAVRELQQRLAQLPEAEREDRARAWLVQLDEADAAIDRVTAAPGMGTPHPETEAELADMLQTASARCAGGQAVPLEQADIVGRFRRRHGLA